MKSDIFDRLPHDEWHDEFEEGEDYEKLTGQDLRDFQQLGGDCSPRSPSLMIFYEPGIDLPVPARRTPGIFDRLQQFLF